MLPAGPPTNFTALSVGGVPIFGGMGIAAGGNYFFVDAVNGSDGNTGTNEDPFATLGQAYAKMVDGNNDVAVIVGDGSTAATQRLSAALTWAKDACHIIGMTAPTPIASRARISTATGATANINPLVTVSAQGCMFLNFSLFQGVGEAATAEQLWKDTGQRNYYGFVHFGGMGGVAGADHASSYCLSLTGGGERFFKNCAIGTDTRTRGAANASLQLRSAATRDIFEDCYFPAYADAATPVFVDAGAVGAIDRFTLFRRCFFHNAQFGGPAGTEMTALAAYHASQGGSLVFDNCTVVGVADYGAADTAVIRVAGPVPNGDTSGMAVANDAT